MALQHLKIRNFRNLSSLELDLSPRVNLFVGPNAQGKTSILEAIGYLATCTSHRTRRDEEMIGWGEPAAYACGTLVGEDSRTLEFGLSSDGKQLKVDGAVLKRVGELYGHLRVVLFVPEDLEIVSGSPSERRRFIDLTLSQVDSRHIRNLQIYQQVLRSRNQLLKRGQMRGIDPDELESWDRQLIEAADPIVASRRGAAAELASDLERFYNEITDERETLLMRYHCSISEDEDQSFGEAFAQKLIANRDRDVQHGVTSSGPHRDDLQFVLEERELRTFGSQGQRRTSVLALRLAEREWLRGKIDAHPVMLIDDVIHEMDEGRRTHFFQEIDLGGQVLITATEPEHLAPLLSNARLFEVSEGKVTLRSERC